MHYVVYSQDILPYFQGILLNPLQVPVFFLQQLQESVLETKPLQLLLLQQQDSPVAAAASGEAAAAAAAVAAVPSSVTKDTLNQIRNQAVAVKM
jgi:hypothetical protein